MILRWLFFFSIFFLEQANLCNNTRIIRSKKFDCSYLVSNDINTGNTIITPLIDNKKEPNETIELLETISFIDIVEEEQYESLLCYSKDDPYVIYHIPLRGKGTNRISIEHLLSVKSDTRYLTILDENKRMFVHGMVVDQDTIFLAVSSHKEEFGNDGSFILALYMARSPEKQIKILPIFILPIAAHDTYYNNGTNNNKKLHAIAFEKRTQTLLCSLEVETTATHKTPLSALLCIPVQSQQLKDETGQAFITKNLLIAHIDDQKQLELSEDARCISIDAMQCMMTSTALPYVILATQNDMNALYAFPLSNKGIASKHKQPKDIFFVEGLKRFVYRLFIEQAQSFDDINIDNTAIRVGANCSIDGDKKSIKIFGDSVIMLVEKNSSDFALYKSTALFEPSGTIKGWTRWQLVHQQETPIIDFELDRLSGELIIVEKTTIIKISWNQKERTNPLLAAVDDIVKKDHRIKHATMQTVSCDTGNTTLFGLVTNDTIFLSNLNNSSMQSLRYDEIGQLNHISISQETETKEEHIFVSGSKGIAHIIFDEKNKIITAKKIFDQCDIKKIIYDNGMLYALTQQELYRTLFSPDEQFVKWETILKDEQKKEIGKLQDFIISDSFACLFSLTELWVTKSEQNVRYGKPQFEQFSLPQQIGAPVWFSFLSETGNITDIARGIGGNLFVLCSNFSLGRSQLYRIAITPSEKNKIKLFEDIVLENKRGPFLNFGSLQKTCFTDGYRFLLLDSSKQVSLSTQPRVGIVMSGNKLVRLPVEDFQNAPILYTGTNQCTGELFVVTENSVHIYN